MSEGRLTVNEFKSHECDEVSCRNDDLRCRKVHAEAKGNRDPEGGNPEEVQDSMGQSADGRPSSS